MADVFSSYQDHVSDPSSRAIPITPSDTLDLADTPKAIYVGTGGNLTLIGLNASSTATGVLFKNVPDGAILPFRARRVLATGTTAADLLALL